MFEIEWNINQFRKVYKPMVYYSFFLIGLRFVFVYYVWNRVAQSTRNFLNDLTILFVAVAIYIQNLLFSLDRPRESKTFSLETLKRFSNLYKNKTSRYSLYEYRNS